MTLSQSVVTVRLPDALLQDVSEQARLSGVSLEEWFVKLAADTLSEQRAAERFFNHPPSPEDAQTMREILNSINDGPTLPGDER
jgi:hypothetical protein